jgi:chromosome segregation ATPase
MDIESRHSARTLSNHLYMNSPRHKRSSTREFQPTYQNELSLSGSTLLDPSTIPATSPVSQAYLSAMAALQSQVARLETEKQKLADHILAIEGEAAQVRQFWEDKVRQLAEARLADMKASKSKEEALKRDVEGREIKIRELVTSIEGLEVRAAKEIEKLKQNIEVEVQRKKEASLRFENEERKASMLKVEVEEYRQQIASLKSENHDLVSSKRQSVAQIEK